MTPPNHDYQLNGFDQAHMVKPDIRPEAGDIVALWNKEFDKPMLAKLHLALPPVGLESSSEVELLVVYTGLDDADKTCWSIPADKLNAVHKVELQAA